MGYFPEGYVPEGYFPGGMFPGGAGPGPDPGSPGVLFPAGFYPVGLFPPGYFPDDAGPGPEPGDPGIFFPVGLFPVGYVPPGYFPDAGSGPGPEPPTPVLRDRHVLKLIRDALVATGQFDEVSTSGLPEHRGYDAGERRLAVLDLVDWREADHEDDYDAVPQIRDCQFTLLLAVRAEDADLRDDELDRLAQVSANAINGQVFGGVTHPEWTRLGRGRWSKPVAPERRMLIAGTFRYEVDDWDTRNSTPDPGA